MWLQPDLCLHPLETEIYCHLPIWLVHTPLVLTVQTFRLRQFILLRVVPGMRVLPGVQVLLPFLPMP